MNPPAARQQYTGKKTKGKRTSKRGSTGVSTLIKKPPWFDTVGTPAAEARPGTSSVHAAGKSMRNGESE